MKRNGFDRERPLLNVIELLPRPRRAGWWRRVLVLVCRWFTGG